MITFNSEAVLKQLYQDVAVKRTTGAFINGWWVADIPQSFEIQAAVMRADPEDLKQLPQGFQTDKVLKLLTKTELFLKQENGQGDIIEYNNQNWLVYSVFHSIQASFYRILCISEQK